MWLSFLEVVETIFFSFSRRKPRLSLDAPRNVLNSPRIPHQKMKWGLGTFGASETLDRPRLKRRNQEGKHLASSLGCPSRARLNGTAMFCHGTNPPSLPWQLLGRIAAATIPERDALSKGGGRSAVEKSQARIHKLLPFNKGQQKCG